MEKYGVCNRWEGFGVYLVVVGVEVGYTLLYLLLCMSLLCGLKTGVL